MYEHIQEQIDAQKSFQVIQIHKVEAGTVEGLRIELIILLEEKNINSIQFEFIASNISYTFYISKDDGGLNVRTNRFHYILRNEVDVDKILQRIDEFVEYNLR